MRRSTSLGLIMCAALLASCNDGSDVEPSDEAASSSAEVSSAASSAPMQGALLKIDDSWNVYQNKELGFTIRVPERMSVEPGTLANVRVYENVLENTVFIAPSIYQNVGDTAWESTDAEAFYSNRSKKIHAWVIRRVPAATEADIDAFIKTTYGPGCSLGAKTLTAEGTNFTVKGDGKPAEETTCLGLLNATPVLRYSPLKKALFVWSIPKNAFFTAVDGKATYDDEMLKSFRIL